MSPHALLANVRCLDETLDDFRAFSKRTKVPVATMVRDALDVFAVLLKDCRNYPEWQKRIRAAITAGVGVRD